MNNEEHSIKYFSKWVQIEKHRDLLPILNTKFNLILKIERTLVLSKKTVEEKGLNFLRKFRKLKYH